MKHRDPLLAGMLAIPSILPRGTSGTVRLENWEGSTLQGTIANHGSLLYKYEGSTRHVLVQGRAEEGQIVKADIHISNLPYTNLREMRLEVLYSPLGFGVRGELYELMELPGPGERNLQVRHVPTPRHVPQELARARYSFGHGVHHVQLHVPRQETLIGAYIPNHPNPSAAVASYAARSVP